MPADEFLSVIKAEIVGKKGAAASVDRDQLVVAAADIDSAFDALLDLVSFSGKFAPFSSGIYVIALVYFNLYCFYRQMLLPPLGLFINYTALRGGFVTGLFFPTAGCLLCWCGADVGLLLSSRPGLANIHLSLDNGQSSRGAAAALFLRAFAAMRTSAIA